MMELELLAFIASLIDKVSMVLLNLCSSAHQRLQGLFADAFDLGCALTRLLHKLLRRGGLTGRGMLHVALFCLRREHGTRVLQVL